MVHPGGREPGIDDDMEAENDDVEMTTVGDSLAKIDADLFEEEVFAARIELARHRMGAEGGGMSPLFAPASSLLTATFPRTEWLVRGLLTARSVAMIGAEPKATKTWAALEVLLSVATGTRAFGEFATCERRHVAAFMTEDSPASLRNRLLALANGRRMAHGLALERVHFRCLTSLDLRKDKDCGVLVASIRRLPEPPAVVLVDPLRNVIGDADENSASEMAMVTNSLRAIRNVTGASILAVHHSGKASKQDGPRRGGQRLRGSSVIHGALDCGFYMGGTHGNMHTNWKNTVEVEIKGARGAGVFGVELDVVDDDDGAAKVAGWRYYADPDDMDPQPDEDEEPKTKRRRAA